MFEVGGIYGFSDPNIREEVAVTICVKNSPIRLIRLNSPSDSNVSEYVKDLDQQEMPMCLGGPDLQDKFFYFHRFSSISNSIKITKDLYLGGNVAEIILLNNVGKLHPSNIRFYTGCHDLTEIKDPQLLYKKIGDLRMDEIFIDFSEINSYWAKRYANFIVDASKLVNAEYISHEQLNNLEKPLEFFKSKLWLKPWLILSILMNTISIINVGIDLKMVVPKWIGFFQFFLDFAREVAHVITYPFQFILNFWNIEIPEIVSSMVLFVGIIFGSLRQATKETDHFFKKNAHSKTSKRYRRRYLYYVLELTGNYSIGLGLSILYSALMWLFLPMNAIVVPSIFVSFILLFLIEILLRKWSNLEDKYRMRVFKFYILSVCFLLVLFSFINYCGLELLDL